MGSAVALGLRLFHINFYKCGSQWVRDILADPRITAHSNHVLAASGVDRPSERWVALRTSEFASPFYSTSTGGWKREARLLTDLGYERNNNWQPLPHFANNPVKCEHTCMFG